MPNRYRLARGAGTWQIVDDWLGQIVREFTTYWEAASALRLLLLQRLTETV